jgi:hypothetical protein
MIRAKMPFSKGWFFAYSLLGLCPRLLWRAGVLGPLWPSPRTMLPTYLLQSPMVSKRCLSKSPKIKNILQNLETLGFFLKFWKIFENFWNFEFFLESLEILEILIFFWKVRKIWKIKKKIWTFLKIFANLGNFDFFFEFLEIFGNFWFL